jgi:AAA15 family ATPase/GTPase
MLVSFSVSNFLSFNNEERFEMKAGRVLKKKEHIIFAEKK